MIDDLRKDKKSKLIDDFDIDKISALSNEPTFDSGAAELIQSLLNQHKAVLQMRYIDDKTFEEIALSLKISPMNVRQILSPGIKRLEGLMNEGDQS